VVKEMAPHPAWKLAWNTAQEAISVRILHITRGRRLVPLDPSRYRQWMTAAGLTVNQRSLHLNYLHPHHLLVGRKPATSHRGLDQGLPAAIPTERTHSP
jgi:hypothetical protein